MSIKFEFHKAKAWFEDHLHYNDPFQSTKDIIAWNLLPENWQKWEKGQAKNFLVMKRCKKISKFIQLSNDYKDIYPNGLFVIADYDPSWLLFVFPTSKSYIGDDKLYADHYSAPYDKQSNRINFHRTIYTMFLHPTVDQSKPYTGMTNQLFQRFKDGTNISNTSFMRNFEEGPIRNSIIDLLKYPQQAAQHTPQDSEHRGSGPLNTSLAIKWKANKIQNILIIAIKQPNTSQYTITAFIHDALKRRDSESRRAFSFITYKSPNSTSIKSKIISHLQQVLEDEPLES